jgi:hypothetical protein
MDSVDVLFSVLFQFNDFLVNHQPDCSRLGSFTILDQGVRGSDDDEEDEEDEDEDEEGET